AENCIINWCTSKGDMINIFFECNEKCQTYEKATSSSYPAYRCNPNETTYFDKVEWGGSLFTP
ncbi:hypothetical protein L9F63_019295, partial [Diploptera punctata]